jgi:serine protease AprX
MEMLPLYYYFRCTYNGKTKTKLWNVNNNPNVLFTYDGSNLFKEAEAGEEFVSDWSGISTKSYPTPFSTVLNIEYTTTEDADVTIEIFDVAGRKVRTLESSFVSNGSHTTTWDGTSDSGNILESGTYYYVIIAGENTQTGIISFVK